jgi:L-ascorbate metabolism protein UlaG (beta-lactamase superfamily)
MATSITLVGGPTALIEVDGLVVLTDPTFDAPGEYPIPGGVLVKTAGPAIAAADLPKVDLVTLSHAHHPDNLDASGAELLATVGTVVGTPMAHSQIASVVALQPWATTTVSASNGRQFVVTAVPARHGPVGCEEITGDVSGFVLESAGSPTIYISGDNAAVELVDEIVARFPAIDVAVLFTGAARVGLFDNAPLTLTVGMAAEVAQKLVHAKVFPVHSEGWAHFSEDRKLLEGAFAIAGVSERLFLAAPGESIQF